MRPANVMADKNGITIHEGDTLQFPNGTTAKVFAAFVYGEYLLCVDEEGVAFPLERAFRRCYEIIG